jgi:hypothetical protein
VAGEIGGPFAHKGWIVAEEAEPAVAGAAEEAAHMAGHVAVVDAQWPRRWPLADGAGAVLRLAQALVGRLIEAVFALALLRASPLAERGIAVVARAPLTA